MYVNPFGANTAKNTDTGMIWTHASDTNLGECKKKLKLKDWLTGKKIQKNIVWLIELEKNSIFGFIIVRTV